ncbi:MAG: DUF1289 domain-containing protein [Xanthomonadales bacterium]|nr:DUF1289 domain-containing protein [Xanthomonadales bacterium]
MIEPSLSAPCVRQCCLDDQDICMGCGRSLGEILEWHSADAEARTEMLDRARDRRAQRGQRLTRASGGSGAV